MERGGERMHETVDRLGRGRLEERLCVLTQPWDSHSLMQRPRRCGWESVLLSASSVVTSTVLARPSLLFTGNNQNVSCPLGPGWLLVVVRIMSQIPVPFHYWVNNAFLRCLWLHQTGVTRQSKVSSQNEAC